MDKNDVYLYGMILITNSFLLQNQYPKPDHYAEISGKYSLPGGETGTCATVLAGFGCNVIMDGTHMGNRTYSQIAEFYKDKTVDTSRLYLDKSFDGLEDYVIIDQQTRTPFGMFGQYYSDRVKRWSEPQESDILSSKVVGLDPWFEDQSQTVASICNNNGIPYITIDCPYDSVIHQYSSINILSGEYISSNYKADRDSLFVEYTNNTKGLVIFTLGADSIMYGRKGEKIKSFTPYKIPVVSTLGAGDAFKAGCVYAKLNNMSDDDTVRFAAATAACACTAFPLPLNPPSLDKIHAIQQ